jgi:tetratricopeptide (TPR) repeat protein
MWYQVSPYEAYLHVGRYDEVIALADALLSKTDDLEEAHYYKGLALRALGRQEEARRKFETALRYNKNYQDAQRALASAQ